MMYMSKLSPCVCVRLVCICDVVVDVTRTAFIAFGSFSVVLPCIPPSDVGKFRISTFQWRVLKNVTIHATKHVTTSVNMITRELTINGVTGTVGSRYYVGARYYCVIDSPDRLTIVYAYNVVGVCL
jgi:hypothetical protein